MNRHDLMETLRNISSDLSLLTFKEKKVKIIKEKADRLVYRLNNLIIKIKEEKGEIK